MGQQFDPRIVKTFVRQIERVPSSDDLLEHWAALQQEARLQRVMAGIPMRKLGPQGSTGTGPLGRAKPAADAALS